jgi:hypothetical protein
MRERAVHRRRLHTGGVGCRAVGHMAGKEMAVLDPRLHHLGDIFLTHCLEGLRERLHVLDILKRTT